jgi:hypothetical protein
MPMIAATLIENITSSVPTTDGRRMVLKARTSDDVHLVLGIARDQIAELIDHCAFSNAQCESILRAGLELKTSVSWWTSAMNPLREFELAITFGKGGTLTFSFSEPMAKALLATLRCHFNEQGGESESGDACFAPQRRASQAVELSICNQTKYFRSTITLTLRGYL